MRPIRLGEKLAGDGRNCRGVHIEDAYNIFFSDALTRTDVEVYHMQLPSSFLIAPNYTRFSLPVSDSFLSKRFFLKIFFCARALYNEMNEINKLINN